MKLCKLKRMAAVSAVALGFAVSGGSAWAACAVATPQNIDAQDPFQVQLCANVENTFGTDVTDVNFGNVGVTGWAAESGCLYLLPDGTFDESNTACLGSGGAAPVTARIVAEDSAGIPALGVGQIEINGAFPDQEIRMWFQVAQTTNEVDPDVAVGPSMWITQLVATTDGLAVGGQGVNVQDGLWEIDVADAPEAANLAQADTDQQADADTYKGTTDAATGDLTISIGATIQTDTTFAYAPDGTGDRYATDTYEGEFEVVLFY